jgi:hypothetical protein
VIDVVIPAHPARVASGMLARAVASVQAQTVPARAVVQLDAIRAGSAATRTAGLAGVVTPWVAFLDSDDVLDPEHLEKLVAHADATGADLVYPWFRVDSAPDPWPHRFGMEFDPQALRWGNYIPVTVLARTEAVRAAGGFIADLKHAPPAQCDEWGLWLRMLDRGARFAHLPERTWTWVAHSGNTSGSPRLGDAKLRRATPDRRPA